MDNSEIVAPADSTGPARPEARRSINKSDVVAAVADRSGVTQHDARRCLDAFLRLVCEQVASGGEVNLTGYMRISAVARQARTGRNLRTGEAVAIPARTGVRIQPGTKLKAAALR